MDAIKNRTCSTFNMITYSTGECASSLLGNTLSAFAMLYYTDALGLSSALAGTALGVSVLWNGIIGPIMGHISDNTRSRYGRRHPYMLVGGLAMVVGFFFVWYVPEVFARNATWLFWYLMIVNMMVRTAFTVFMIPYIALGFEICTDYAGRTKLQGVKGALNMIANLCGPALSWTIFFGNNENVRATSVSQNYLNMGTVFTVICLFFVMLVFWSTLKYRDDCRGSKLMGNSIAAFLLNMREIITDRFSRWVFAYQFTGLLGLALASILQMYLYEHFMRFAGIEKTLAHGGTMVGAGLGGLFASVVVRHFDKKPAIYIGCLFSVVSNLILAALFLPGFLKPGQSFLIAGIGMPIASVVFIFFHAAYWFGIGVMGTVAFSMLADVSEIHELKTGTKKDGGYSSVFGFASELSISIGTMLSGYCLMAIGFVAGKVQSSDVVLRLAAITFLAGPIISLIALVLIHKYPVDRDFIERIRKEAAAALCSGNKATSK